MAAQVAKKTYSPFMTTMRKWFYKNAGFNKYGLRYHDVLHEYPHVKEALRRLPKHVVDERNYRIIRAYQCSIQKVYLPEDQWTKLEDDDFYLQAHLDEVEREIAEKKEWEQK